MRLNRSTFHLAIVAVAVVGLTSMGCQREEAKPPPNTDYAKLAPEPAAKPGSAVESSARPPVHVTEVGAASGVTFTHTTGAFGQKWMPETMGAGVCFLDADGDGAQDLFFVDSDWFDGHRPEPGSEPSSRLYLQRAAGAFEDATDAWGLRRSLYGQGCAVADYDGDGDQDLYITALGDNALLRNDRNRFIDVTDKAGVAGGRWTDDKGKEHPEWSTSAAFADLDGDGWLDLFVANYVRWSPESDVYSTLDGSQKGYSLPSVYPGQTCRFFRNRGDGTFEDRTREAGLENHHGKSLGVAVADLDADGLPDIFVTNDTEPNFLYHNDGAGHFTEVGITAGVAYDESGRARAGMGVDIAPLGPEQRLTIGIGNFSNEPVSMYQQMGPGVFLDVAGKARVSRASLSMLTFGLLFQDLDLDGNLDLLVANGHIEPEVGLISKDVTYRQPLQVYFGDAEGRFREGAAELGADLVKPIVGRGLATGDIDRDGDADLVVTENGGPAHLFRVDTPGSVSLRVTLRGAAPNTDAIGATVRLRLPGRDQLRSVRSGSSYLSHSELPVVFSLGPEPPATVAVEVTWPGKKEPVVYNGIAAKGGVTIDQTKGVKTGPA